jgi:hypothetical protein
MTLHEKLTAMEALWEDLARSPESIESPAGVRRSSMNAVSEFQMERLDSRTGKRPK